jgi:hypothetical protein
MTAQQATARPGRDPLAEIAEATFREARKVGLSIAEAADALAQALRRRLGEEYLATAPADQVLVQSIVSATTGDPLVQCRVGLESWQWTPQDAREHALWLLACAEAAIHDAAMQRWLVLHMNLEPAVAAGAMSDLRRFRGDVPREHWKADE